MVSLSCTGVWLALCGALAVAQTDEENHRRVYEIAAPSVVAVRAVVAGGERSGSGVVLTKDGLLLVSYAVVPEGAQNIRVWMKGPRLCRGEVAGTSKRDEVTILRVKPKEELTPIVFGSSGEVRIGDVAYTLGNASNSMINNDQPSLNVGLISGAYRLGEPRASSWYVGPVFETTAAVNVGMEGAPLLDAAGRMVGLVTLNYSPHRFLGNAIPIDSLKETVALLREGKHPSQASAAQDTLPPEGEAYFGATVVDRRGTIVIDAVEEGSPAEAAGLRQGVVILSAGARTFKNAAEFAAFVRGLRAGALLTLSIDDDGLKDEVRILLNRKE
ncbi:MAG: serine protease [Planctomycetes bacterium]|nr:serine protease [Planctomycetota bacterium]